MPQNPHHSLDNLDHSSRSIQNHDYRVFPFFPAFNCIPQPHIKAAHYRPDYRHNVRFKIGTNLHQPFGEVVFNAYV